MKRSRNNKVTAKHKARSFKPEIITLNIKEIGARGHGVGYHKGLPAYVPFTVTGDVVKAAITKPHKNSYQCELIQVEQAGPDRQAPICPVFGMCGGCDLQALGNDSYQAWVTHRTLSALQHQGFGIDGSPINVLAPLISPKHSRRRVALKAVRTEKGTLMGFHKAASLDIVDTDACPIADPALADLIIPLKALLNSLLAQGTRASVHMTLAANGVDMLIGLPNKPDLEAREALANFAQQHDLAALHVQEDGFLDPIIIQREPVMNFAGVRVQLPPASFVQATAAGETALIAAVLAGCEGATYVADLFCGLGTFTLPLARRYQVMAVEGALSALQPLKAAVNLTQTTQGGHLQPVTAVHRDLFRSPLTATELSKFDAVVFDPPRAGAAGQVAELARSNVPKIVAVSCNPNTFSRDARTLVDGGYMLQSVQPIDQFLYSAHIELVGVFTRYSETNE